MKEELKKESGKKKRKKLNGKEVRNCRDKKGKERIKEKKRKSTWKMILILSKGATIVFAIRPAKPPERKALKNFKLLNKFQSLWESSFLSSRRSFIL